MAAATALRATGDVAARFEGRAATREPRWVKGSLVAVSLTFFTLFLLMPLIAVFVEALRKGWDTYLTALIEPDALSAIKLTLIAAL
ncbi:MAG: sulfate/thiosulfate ABC transporter permease CysW, partial [Gammaproteobacteria bacterium]|nr:sulfate/thiosulfate ABC transporter permease CysW [Gammaproteobacteria bacterium]